MIIYFKDKKNKKTLFIENFLYLGYLLLFLFNIYM